MVVICLGPVCIPLWPIIALTLKPAWDRFVPDSWKQSLSRLWTRITDIVCAKRKDADSLAKKKRNTSDTACIGHIQSVKDFDNALAESHKRPIVIKFTAGFCGPCKLIAPHFELHAINLQSRIGFYELDIEALDSVALEVGVSSIPAFHVFVGGNKKAELVGGNVEKLDKLIEDINNQSKYKV
jgi:thioredoxin-like negative regulator of GroEL